MYFVVRGKQERKLADFGPGLIVLINRALSRQAIHPQPKMSCLWIHSSGSYDCNASVAEPSSVEEFPCEASLKINGFAFDPELAQQLACRTESQDIRLRSIRRNIIDLVIPADDHSPLV